MPFEQLEPYTRNCPVCGARLTPFTPKTFTAHEFMCYKKDPTRVPEEFKAEFESTLVWERRSAIAKKAALKRKAIAAAKRGM
jgi:hypothetical protein